MHKIFFIFSIVSFWFQDGSPQSYYNILLFNKVYNKRKVVTNLTPLTDDHVRFAPSRNYVREENQKSFLNAIFHRRLFTSPYLCHFLNVAIKAYRIFVAISYFRNILALIKTACQMTRGMLMNNLLNHHTMMKYNINHLWTNIWYFWNYSKSWINRIWNTLGATK